MHWTAYEIFSVISGFLLLILAFIPQDKASNRLWCGVGGLAFIVYGIYVANQTSGTYYFPALIFIVPVLAALYVIRSLVSRGAGRGAAPLSRKSPPLTRGESDRTE